MKLQKLGGYSSIALVLVYLILIGLMPLLGASEDPAEMMAASHASPSVFRAYYVCIFLIGTLTLLISLAIKERMQAKFPHLMSLFVIAASIFCSMYLIMSANGVIRLSLSETDFTVYKVLMTMWTNFSYVASCALGFGLLMVGYAAIKTCLLPRVLAYIFILQGILMIPPLFMGWSPIGSLIGIISFLWLGVVLLREQQPVLTAQV